MKNTDSRFRRSGFKLSLFWLSTLLMTAWVSGCAHTHVATLNAVDPDDLDSSRLKSTILEHHGVWKSETYNEKWYIWDGSEGPNILIMDKDGNTGNFGFYLIRIDSGSALMFMSPELLTHLELSVVGLEFSEDQIVVHPVFTIYYAEESGQTITLSELRPAWIKKMAKKEPENIRFIEVEDMVLMTSPLPDMVQVLEAQDDFHAAFRKFRVLEYDGELP